MKGCFFMKYRTTNKAVREVYGKVYKIGSCYAQTLLRFESPVAYTAGVYGWNSDIYDFGSLAISTGSRPTGCNVDCEIVNRYEKQAKEISCDYTKSYEERKQEIKKLLAAFIAEISK